MFNKLTYIFITDSLKIKLIMFPNSHTQSIMVHCCVVRAVEHDSHSVPELETSKIHMVNVASFDMCSLLSSLFKTKGLQCLYDDVISTFQIADIDITADNYSFLHVYQA